MLIEQVNKNILLNGNVLECLDALISYGIKINSVITHIPCMYGQENDWEKDFTDKDAYINYYNEIFLKLNRLIDCGTIVLVGGKPYIDEIIAKAEKYFNKIKHNYYINTSRINESVVEADQIYIFSKGNHQYHYDDVPFFNNFTLDKISVDSYNVDAYEFLVRIGSNENDFVLDIAMDNGVIGMCCNELNRSYIGIEEKSVAYEIAKQNLEGYKK